jgi:HK97 family phage major capsid protein
VFDVEGDLIDEIGITFADQEAQAFIDGSGVNRPKGFLSYSTVANASYTWGSLGFVVTGGASGFAASNPSDALIDLQHSLKRNYRGGAAFVMNDATLGAIRKFKDGQGIYLWAPSGLQQGVAGQLLGHSVVTDDYMPDLGSNAFPIAFGDFQRGYLIVDRRGTTILRDPYTAKPYVKFFATRRVGGGITNFEAIKLLKCST